jgi:hypothetical protein
MPELAHTGQKALDDEVDAFEATDIIGTSSEAAYEEAERWLADR